MMTPQQSYTALPLGRDCPQSRNGATREGVWGSVHWLHKMMTRSVAKRRYEECGCVELWIVGTETVSSVHIDVGANTKK